MNYQLDFPRPIQKDVNKMPGYLRQRARRSIQALTTNPRPSGYKQLRDRPERYRIHLDGWRIIYDIDEENELVKIVAVLRKIGPETYEGLDDEEQE